MSDGLIGVASTRSTTSSAAGSGVATRASESSSSPLSLTRERSWSPSRGTLEFMSFAFREVGESYHHNAPIRVFALDTLITDRDYSSMDVNSPLGQTVHALPCLAEPT